MSKFLVISALGFVLILPSSVLAQDLQTPEFRIDDVYIPKYLPPHPLYFLKTMRDNLKLFFTFDKVEKAQSHLDLSNKRVLELSGIWEKGNFGSVDGLLANYQKNWERFFKLISKMKVNEFDRPSQKARRNFQKQKEILTYLEKNAFPALSQKIASTVTIQEEKFNHFFNKFQGIDQLEKFKEELK